MRAMLIYICNPFGLEPIGDRQKVFRIIDDYYNLVIDLGGSTSGEHGDGRLRAPYLPKLMGNRCMSCLERLRQF